MEAIIILLLLTEIVDFLSIKFRAGILVPILLRDTPQKYLLKVCINPWSPLFV